MEYTIKHNGPSGVCIVRVSGKIRRPRDSITLQKLAHEIRAETGCVKYLCDMSRAATIGGTMEILATGKAPAKGGLERDVKIAGVYSGNMADHKFLEDVVVNRGYIFRAFDSSEKAMAWLTDDRPAG